MVNEVYVSPEFNELLEELCSTFAGTDFKSLVPKAKEYFPTMSEIPISRVTYSGDTTVVFFTDGTKTTVKCSSNDTYDRQTAIVYALIKRLFGKIGRYDSKTKKFYENEIDGNGLGTKLEKLAAAGFDQDEEKRTAKARKAKAQEEHAARQKRESEAAWKKKVAKRAEEIKLEREAAALVDSLRNPKKVLNESTMDANEFFGGGEQKTVTEKPLDKKSEIRVEGDPKDAWKFYRKPNKPFSQFTSEEKREYWRYHNGKRRAEGKR